MRLTVSIAQFESAQVETHAELCAWWAAGQPHPQAGHPGGEHTGCAAVLADVEGTLGHSFARWLVASLGGRRGFPATLYSQAMAE
jgi:hypothetical protein